MMDAVVEQLCGAGYGEVSPERVNSRNGYRRGSWLDIGHLMTALGVTGSPDGSPPHPSHERGGRQIVSSGSSAGLNVDDSAPEPRPEPRVYWRVMTSGPISERSRLPEPTLCSAVRRAVGSEAPC